MFNPKVSIIIPVYNGSNYIAEAIESALTQTYDNLEILVVNDGSRDEWATEKIALSYGDRIRYIQKENGWVATALNRWIKEMTGEYFSWLSHDDLYFPTKIAEQISEIAKDGTIDIVYCNFEFIDAQKKLISKYENTYLFEKNLLYNCIFWRYPIQGCCLLIRTSTFNDIGYFNTKYHCVQDYDMWFRMLSVNLKFKYIDHVLVQYRRHATQGSTFLNLNCLREEIKIYNPVYLFRKFSIKTIVNSSPTKTNYIKIYLKILYDLCRRIGSYYIRRLSRSLCFKK